jgi:hypothetical protein
MRHLLLRIEMAGKTNALQQNLLVYCLFSLCNPQRVIWILRRLTKQGRRKANATSHETQSKNR